MAVHRLGIASFIDARCQWIKITESWQFILSAAGLAGVAIFLYRAILFPTPVPAQIPWSSDALGHAFKAEYLEQKIAEGDIYPDLLPDWYMGIQMLRYYPPLPYYVLVGLMQLVGDSITALGWYIALFAFMGSVGWLLHRRWIGFWPALLGGFLFLYLPDNVRVALAEGNLPRVLATGLLPFSMYFMLRALEEGGKLRFYIALSLSFSLIVLSHAMMPAIYSTCFMLLATFLLFGRWTTITRAAGALICILLGLTLAGWWLFPSLTGGITEINASAMTEALAVVPLLDYFHPGLRVNNPEVLYVGAALLVTVALGLFNRKLRDRYSIALALVGLFGVLITTPYFNHIFNALPLHNLLWPIRFLGIASFMLLMALMSLLSRMDRGQIWFSIAVLSLVALDGAGSLPLIHLRLAPKDQLAISEFLSSTPGWREATLDQSRWGSSPTYYFSAYGEREQVFGWAYQGARTARTVSAINEAMEQGHIPYLVDRLNLLGTDDVVIPQDALYFEQISTALAASGYEQVFSEDSATVFHRDGGPRALAVDWKILGIGSGAQNLAYIFPQIHLGTSTKVDDYPLDELVRFETLILSGFGWRDQRAAERLVMEAASRGVRVVVDLTGIPEDPVARIPRFLDVWGEPLILSTQEIQLTGSGGTYHLLHFGNDDNLWYTLTPQGLDATTINLDYLGQQATALGYKDLGKGRAWFLGLNLPYHAMLTKDPVAIDILANLLGAKPDEISKYAWAPLSNYSADQSGYRFTYSLEHDQVLLFPVAAHEGIHLTIDGGHPMLYSYENLLAFTAPAGTHHVEVLLQPTSIYSLGYLASVFSLFGLFGILFWKKRSTILAFLPARKFITVLIVLCTLFLIPTRAEASAIIALDGDFGDWQGQAHVDDPQGDAKNGPTDLRALYFATNPDEEMLYFMVERWEGGSKPILTRLFIDTDDNGNFNDGGDRWFSIRYEPRKNGSQVSADLYDGSGKLLANIANSADWGESVDEGGLRFEWGVSFSQLGIVSNQNIRMYTETADGNDSSDRNPDAGDVQWSPANILGYPLLAAMVFAGAGWLIYSRKRLR